MHILRAKKEFEDAVGERIASLNPILRTAAHRAYVS
jgi:hypothetical protein